VRIAAVLLGALVLTASCTSDDGTPEDDIQTRSGLEVPASLEGWFAAPPDPPITEAADGWLEASCSMPKTFIKRILRGYYPERSQDVLFVPRAPNIIGEFDYTTHGGPWRYLQEVPLVLYGPGFIKEQGDVRSGREVTVADIAPTIAELVGFDWGRGRAGRPLHEALVPEAQRTGTPKLVLTMVWDGGGIDALQAWPKAWPHLRRLMREGTSYVGATVGSAPSVTPPVHTTIGTGVFPDRHGIVDLTQRKGDAVPDAFGVKAGAMTPENMEISTVADDYDLAVGNRAEIGMLGHRGWHLGMMSQGAFLPGADKDLAALVDRRDGHLATSEQWYSMPDYVTRVPGLDDDIRRADLDDGKIDDKWMGHVSLSDEEIVQYTPAWTLYQTRLLQALLRNEPFGSDDLSDLFFVNYKQIDDVGHFYNMLSEEMREILRYTDSALRDVTRLLDRQVGKGAWVLILTADHGTAPEPEAVGSWPIGIKDSERWLSRELGFPMEAFLQERTMGFWFDREILDEHGVTLEEIADKLIDYRIEDTVASPDDVPEAYRDRLREPVFEAAFPGEGLPRIARCAGL
jgi:hypothetical protein